MMVSLKPQNGRLKSRVFRRRELLNSHVKLVVQNLPLFPKVGGPQRRSNGELISRAIAMLPILTGNVGIHGGNTGARESAYSIPFVRMPTLKNPVKASIPMFFMDRCNYSWHRNDRTYRWYSWC